MKELTFFMYNFIHTNKTVHLARRVKIKDSRDSKEISDSLTINVKFISHVCTRCTCNICKLSCKGTDTLKEATDEQRSSWYKGWLAFAKSSVQMIAVPLQNRWANSTLLSCVLSCSAREEYGVLWSQFLFSISPGKYFQIWVRSVQDFLLAGDIIIIHVQIQSDMAGAKTKKRSK